MAEPREVELRGNVTRSFLQRLDAVAQSEGMGRMEWLVPVVEKEIERRVHVATVLMRMLADNPPPPDRGDV
jgi:hypothetical protein